MLEAHDLEEEVVELLILNLTIPLPSTQNAASVREIFFPVRLTGFLMSQMLEYRLIDRMREMLGQVVKGI
jgi:myosin V